MCCSVLQCVAVCCSVLQCVLKVLVSCICYPEWAGEIVSWMFITCIVYIIWGAYDLWAPYNYRSLLQKSLIKFMIFFKRDL